MATKDNSRTRLCFSILIKCLNVAAVCYGLSQITEGMTTMTKFTTLSNVGIAVVMVIFLLAMAAEKMSGRTILDRRMYDLKFIMTAGVVLTFLIFLCVLAPTSKSGFIGAYLYHNCGSMSMHLISPLLATVDFYINDRDYLPSIKTALASTLFPVAYVAYIMFLSAAGYRWSHGMYAPYNFLNYGAPTGWWGLDLSLMSKATLGIGVGYMVIFMCFLLVALTLLLRRIKMKFSA